MTFTQDSVKALERKVSERLGERRFLHTKGVANCAAKLAELCGIDSKIEAEIAAYLHDITKEYSCEEQLSIIKEYNIILDAEDVKSPAVLHSFTAEAIIKSDFPEFATDKILSAVRYHTLGSPDMTEFDEIIFLADFIEETRSYPACVELRKFVFSNMKDGNAEANILLLHRAVISAIDATVKNLTQNNRFVNSKNLLTKEALLSKISTS